MERKMSKMPRWILIFVASLLALVGPSAFAGDKDPLFISLTTDDPHRASMAIAFGGAQLERGHTLTIFLSDRGVLIGSKANAKFAGQQAALAELARQGAVVLVCQMCMQHYGVTTSDLASSVTVGDAQSTGAALFKDKTRSLTW